MSGTQQNENGDAKVHDRLCSGCQTITVEGLLKTRPFVSGTHHTSHNNAGELEEEYHTPCIDAIYHTILLDDPERTVQTCPACKLFNKATYGGISLSRLTVLRLFLSEDRRWLKIEDVGKVEAELARAEGTAEVAKLDGKGTVSVFTNHGEVIHNQWGYRRNRLLKHGDTGSKVANSFPGRQVGNGGSDSTVECMKRWTKECDLNHATCSIGMMGNEVEDNPIMPTRVVAVGSIEDFQPPKLLETYGARGKYIAVSHCWGTEVQSYTTRKRVEPLKKSIDFNSLPKTFKDSIFIARKLRTQYVWIDSICIVQDDPEDWERESRKMGLVYEKAYLTISASTAPGDHAGFLIPHPDMDYDVKVPYCHGDPRLGYLYMRKYNYPSFDPTMTKLSQRGWVVQERALSRRVLHFDDLQVHWECSQHILSEDGRKQDKTSHKNTSYWLGQNLRASANVEPGRFPGQDACFGIGRSAQCALYDFFASTFQRYSNCSLTYPSDKISAVLGLANEVFQETGIPFVDGHFVLQPPLFLYSLLWYSDRLSVEGCGFPDKIRAPSWSWAATEGNRVFHFYGLDLERSRTMLCEFKEIIHLNMYGLDPYNALSFRGRIICANRSEYYLGNRSPFGIWGGHGRERVKPPTAGFAIIEATQPKARTNCLNCSDEAKGWVCFDSRVVKPEQFYIVAVCECRPGEHDFMGGCRECPVMVVVEAEVVDQPGLADRGPVYKRVGLGALKDSTWFDDCVETDFVLI